MTHSPVLGPFVAIHLSRAIFDFASRPAFDSEDVRDFQLLPRADRRALLPHPTVLMMTDNDVDSRVVNGSTVEPLANIALEPSAPECARERRGSARKR